MSNKFGARVIGREAVAREKQIQKVRGRHFGSRVIGQIFERRTQIAETEKDTRSDPAAKQAKKQAAAEAASKQRADAATQVEAPVTANLDELAEALKANPAFYETLYASEQGRAEGPRKGALRLFLAFELEHEDRDDRKAEIEALLKG